MAHYFSIILPTYNRAEFLPRAVESVQVQTYNNWELIIVDDGSTDDTKTVITPYLSDSRVKYIWQNNAERSAARNAGINNASGNFICFMDSDEYFSINRIELLAKSIEKNNNKVALYITDIRFEFPDPNHNYIRKGEHFSFPIDKDKLIKSIIGNPQFCVSVEILKKHFFNPLLTVGEDIELLFRIAEHYPLIYIEGEPTITEIEHENRSVNQKSAASEKQLITLDVMFEKNHPASSVSKKLQKWIRSEVLLNASYDFLIERKSKGLKYLISSFFTNPIGGKNLYKINLLLSYITGNTIKLKRIISGL